MLVDLSAVTEMTKPKRELDPGADAKDNDATCSARMWRRRVEIGGVFK